MTTISKSSTLGVSLTPALYTSPVVVAAGVTISNPGYAKAVYTPFGSSTVFTVQNYGTIIGAGTSFGAGIYLTPGGSVTNAASGLIEGATPVGIYHGGGTVVNYGRIKDLSNGGSVLLYGGGGTVINDGSIYGITSDPGYGVVLFGGGSVTNATAASIAQLDGGIVAFSGAGTVFNYGTIAITGNMAVNLLAGGFVTNAAGALLGGNVYISGTAAGTVINAGSIAGGVLLAFGGTVVNTGTITETFDNRNALSLDREGSLSNGAGATITGSSGVYARYGATVTNAGTIIGTTGAALNFLGTASSLLILEPGFAFSGLVSGSSSATNTLELASAASVGTITGLGSQYIHFRSITFDPGAEWSVTGLQRGLAGPISGFAAGDTIEISGVTAVASSFVGGVLTVFETSDFVTLDLPGTFTAATNFHVTNNADGAAVTVACFCAGTRILTPAGERPVETLGIGDAVATQSGEVRPVKWIGRRSYAGAVLAANPDLLPIRIARGALADGTPKRDLYVSPEHALLLDGVLVPARHLVNDASIIRDRGRDAVRYLHVELATHDIILAEGQPAETFVDCDSRAMFENAAEFAACFPDDPPLRWRFCAERLEDGEVLADIRDRINVRAGLAHGNWREKHVPGRLIGNLEVATGDVVAGWAQDASAPEIPVSLEIVADGHVRGRVLANGYRVDLERAGIGSGRHAFRFEGTARASGAMGEVIQVRRTADRAALPGSPMQIAEAVAPGVA